MKTFLTIGFAVLAAFTCSLPVQAQGRGLALTGSFVQFDRNFTTVQMWEHELSVQAALGQKILVIPGEGSLMPSANDSTGYAVNPATLIYPSEHFPTQPAQLDNLGILLTAADHFGMQVYIGSLQTYGDWSTGAEFSALHQYDPIVAAEILNRYGSHPSLNAGGGNWYFSHEIWLNWVKFYGATYYGTSELGTYVEDMTALNARARVIEAPVFKQAVEGAMPGVSAAEAGLYLAMLVNGSHVAIVAPQDGAGAQAGAPAVSELGNYYSAMHASLKSAIASGSVQLWATTETFQAALAGTESANGWQPAPLARLRQQIAAEAPYVSQMIDFMYGWDMSPEATYTPVEADALLAQYSAARPGPMPLTGETVSYSVPPSGIYSDSFPSKLTNGTGGGFGEPLGSDWVGFAGNPEGIVTVTVDLGGSKTIAGVRTLFAESNASGIYFPQSVLTEYSSNGGMSWTALGMSADGLFDSNTRSAYAVGWITATTSGPSPIASQVRLTVTFREWMFIGEIQVMQPE